jgi:hypothetical protein
MESLEVSPTSVAHDLSLLFQNSWPTDRNEEPDVEGLLWEFWEIITEAASQTTHDHPTQEIRTVVVKALRGF